jgi:hypothetical protein
MKLQFITRQDCPLCDEAAEMLGRLTRRFALDIEEVDVDGDPALLRLYDHSVPVARSDTGKVLAAGRWTESGLIAALTRYRLLRD